MKLEWLEWDRVERLVQRLPELAVRLTLWERIDGRERMVAQQHIDDASLGVVFDLYVDAESETVHVALEPTSSAVPVAPEGRGWHRRRSQSDDEALVQRRVEARSVDRSGSGADPTNPASARRSVETVAAWRARAITRWIRTCALRSVREDTELIGFRVRAHGEGSRPLGSACFSICNLTWIPADDDVPSQRPSSQSTDTRPTGQPGMTSQGPQEDGAGFALPSELVPGEAYHALGRYYAQAGKIWLEGYQNILAVHTTLLHDTLERLRRSHELEDTLQAEVVRRHLEHLQRTLTRERETEDAAMRDALVLQAFAALQDVARAARASYLEASRLAEVRALLDAAPGMVVLLQDPAIQSLLRDPRHVPLLAEVLRTVAAQLAGRRSDPPESG